MGRKIFVNYRRDDSAAHALNIAQYLEREFGSPNVFIDVDRIRSGQAFAQVLAEKLGDCAVLIAVIGPSWLNVKDETGRRRIDDAEDWVRLEIEQALARKIAVIPALVGGASIPKKSDLPASLAPLVERHAITVTTNGFRHEMSGLAQDIRSILPQSRLKSRGAAALAAVLAAGIGLALSLNWDAPRSPSKEAAPDATSASKTAQATPPGHVRSVHGDWQVRCAAVDGQTQDQCAAVQSVVAQDRAKVGMTVVVLRSSEHKLLMRIAAPVGVLMSEGVGLKIDSKEIGRASFMRCTTDNCLAEVVVDPDLLNDLKMGRTATFMIFTTKADGIGLPFSLAGFSEAVAELPS